jgi:mycofactocin system glycosyltransferase
MSLPLGFTVRLGEDVIVDGDLLVGGAPVTAMRLSAAARALVRDGRASVGEPGSAQLIHRLLATDLAHPDLADVPAADPTELTVVVPVRDRAAQLDRALRALAGLHCLVVDDASVDPAPVAAVCRRRGATLLRLEDNVGPAGARNHGLARVRTALVAFVDSDVEIADEDLLLLARHCADPAVALVGPRIRGRSCRARSRWFERYDAVASALTVGRSPANVRPGARVGWLPGACLVARTAAVRSGFDPQLRLGEDVDLVWRLVAAGRSVRYDPAVVADHDSRASAREWLGRLAAYGSSAAPLAERHGRAVAPAILDPALALAGAAVLLRRRWSIPVGAAGVLWAAARVRRVLPENCRSDRLALHLGSRALGWAVRQESALLLRHWWPLVVPAAIVSRPLRRAVVTALLVDSVVAIQASPGASVPDVVMGRRMSDLAYGAGLWYGCWRQRSARALLPRRPRTRACS